MKRIKHLCHWLIQPHPRFTEVEDRRNARLFSGLMLVHFVLVLLAINSINLFYVREAGHHIWSAPDARVVMTGLALIGVAIVLLRLGFYKTAISVYIVDTAAVALWTPFVQHPSAEIGLLASATIPVLLTAMVLSYRWVAGVLAGILVAGILLLSFASLPLRETGTGFSLLIVVAVTGALVLVLKRHLDCKEQERHSAMRKAALKYRNLFDNVPDGVFITDLGGRVVEANLAACSQLCCTRDELTGSSVSDISVRPGFNIDSLTSELRQKGYLNYRTEHKRKNGSTFPVELRLTLIEHQGETNIIGVARDVAEQEAALSFREAVISHAAEGLCVCQQTDQFPYVAFSLWNDRMCEITGYTMEEINRLGWYQTLYPDPELQTKAIDRMSAMRLGKNLSVEEWPIRRKDGQERILEISTSLLRTSDSNEHVLAMMHDVTERKRFERDLSHSERQYRELFDSVMEGIGLVDRNEIILFANPALAKIFEFDALEEMVGKSILDYVAPAFRDNVTAQSAMRARGVSSQYELGIVTAKGNSRCVYLSVTPRLAEDGSYAGALAAALDVTEWKNSERLQVETQQRLERAERMESLGLLAGGVAHDLNNMLGPVAGYAELLLREISPESKIAGRVNKIAKSAHDAANVIQDLLTLARRGRYQMEPLSLNDVIRSYLESPGFEELRRRHPSITMELDLHPDLGWIAGSSSHLSKVIMNLVSNAFEAMVKDGSLTIVTEQRRLDSLIGGHCLSVPGDYVLVRVQDSGVGIPQDDMEKIFEPYFSKKKMDRSGSGLGLSVVYGVVKDHKGYYDVFSEPGKGTEFVIYFPVCTCPAPDNANQASSISGKETVLVVDDSPEQRELSKDVLCSLGYSVSQAENGHEAIAFLKAQPADIVLLDMIMEPGFDGLDTFREILKMNPNQPCIILSGYAETERVHEMQRLGAGPYVRKPFSIEAIGKAVRGALSRRSYSISQ